MTDKRKIGIIDSGVGGLTAAKEFREFLPQESIIYLGDSANVPYGNRAKEEIYALTKKLVDFLIEKDVKLIAVACNTISSLLDEYFLDLQIPIVSIIKPTADHVYQEEIKDIGVIATEFTIDSGIYERYLLDLDKDISIVTEGCPSLAGLIDSGQYTEEEVSQQIKTHMENILGKAPVQDIILGCTHYPIEINRFKEAAPHINFINPAYEQIVYIKKLMEKEEIESDQTKGSFEIYTTGKKEAYLKTLKNLSIEGLHKIYQIDKF